MTDDDTESNEKNIKVFVRVFPLEETCESCAKIDSKHKTICIRCLQDLYTRRFPTAKNHIYWCFRTDGIFYNASQEEVYCATVKNLIEKVLDGVNCTVCSYGHIGSGKSFTIGGFRNNWEHRGLVTRLLSDMFAEKAKRKKANKIQYRLSFVELRGKEVTDLLLAETENRIKINDADVFKNVTITNMKNQKATLRKLFKGEARRSMIPGSMYPSSHLGTAVITFHVSNMSLITSWAVVATAKIHIVEMAGTGTVGKQNCMKSAADVGAANLAQTQLEQLFQYFRGFEIPTKYILRSNNLLKFLGQALSVTSVLRFIAHVCITKEDLDSALSTLRFTSTISKLKPVKIMYNIEPQPEMIIQNLKDEIEMLKRKLEINDIFFNQESSINMSKLKYEEMRCSLLNFLNDTMPDLTLYSVTQMEILLKIVKKLYHQLTLKQAKINELAKTYENALKDINQETLAINVSNDKHDDNLISNGNQNVGGTSSHISIDTSQSVEKEQVGVLNDTGITLIGSVTNEFEKPIKIRKQENPKNVLSTDKEESMTDLKAEFYCLQNMLRAIETKHRPKKKTFTQRTCSKD